MSEQQDSEKAEPCIGHKTCGTCDCEPPTVKELTEAIVKKFPMLKSFLIDGHDNGIIGVSIDKEELANGHFRVVYDQDTIIENCMEFCADYDEAQEYAQYNIFLAYWGEGTPLYKYEMPEEDEF
jgi:hypothetical protein